MRSYVIRSLVVALVAAAAVLVLVAKQSPPASSVSSAGSRLQEVTSDAPMPRLVSLGAGKCIPCKAMEPIREELKVEYADRLRIEYHDVWQDPSAGELYSIRLIPTLIYFDAAGRELGRTEGYMTKAQIIAAFRKLGIDLNRVDAPEVGS